MSVLIRPGEGVIFMKVGTHAQEPLAAIIARKRKEIADAGHALWGYGGSTCHPLTMVQPFAKSFQTEGKKIYLCMQEMESKHFAAPKRAEQCSSDGQAWDDIPEEINVLGSRYALVIKSLEAVDFELPLAHTQVAVGNQRGRGGHQYISGRVDKACLKIVTPEQDAGVADASAPKIGLVAELGSPYAVFLRNRP